MNSIVACCHSAKLCAYAARDFRSQQYLEHEKLSYGKIRHFSVNPNQAPRIQEKHFLQIRATNFLVILKFFLSESIEKLELLEPT